MQHIFPLLRGRARVSLAVLATLSFVAVSTNPSLAVTAPSPTSPSGNTTTSTLAPTLTWSGGDGFASVQINMSKSPYGAPNIVYTSTWLAAASTSVTVPFNLQANTTHRWDVTACSGANGSGVCVTSVNAYFNTPSSLTAPSPSSPSGNQTINTLTPTLTWSGGANFNSLQINMSKSPYGGCPGAGNGNCVYTSNWLSVGSTSLNLPSGVLTPNASYRWDVTACSGSNGSGTCVSSSNAHFSTSAPPLTAPTPTSPTNNQQVGTLTPTLNWSGGANFNSLQINMSKSPYGGCPGAGNGNCVYTSAWLSAGTTSLNLPSGVLVSNTSYRWDVTACAGANGSGTCVSSGNAHFSTQAPPQLADLLPQNVTVLGAPAAAGGAITVRYKVTNQGGKNAPATRTKIQVRNSSNVVVTQPSFDTVAINANSSVTENRPVTIPGNALPGTYKARVIVDNTELVEQSNFENDFSGYVPFAVNSPELDPPVAKPATSITNTEFVANWGSSISATGYRIDVSTNAQFTSYLNDHQNKLVGLALKQKVINLNPDTTYYYRVRALEGTIVSANSNVISVKTQPNIVAPLSLRFPLADFTPYTAPISSVFDHSMRNAYAYNGKVTAVNGDTGSVGYSGDSTCMKDDANKIYLRNLVNGRMLRYMGAASCGRRSYLSYDDHPGYDYSVPDGTPVYAAEAGAISRIECPQDGGSCTNYGRICIRHSSGYVVGYLHLSRQAGGLKNGDPIEKGALIGYSGHTSPFPVSPHLHFEVRKNRNCVPEGSAKAGDPVDPYGWWGATEDPYTILHPDIVNVWLWE